MKHVHENGHAPAGVSRIVQTLESAYMLCSGLNQHFKHADKNFQAHAQAHSDLYERTGSMGSCFHLSPHL